MKIVNVLALFILSAFLLTSCQKELDFGNFQSTGTLKTDSMFDCLPSSVHGIYTEHSVLTDTNYIEVQVNVALSGNYLIQSDTTNGYSFKGEGSFSTTGLNTVRLYATGTPDAPGPNTFIIRYDSSLCVIEIDVIAAVGSAEYTFGGSGGTCTGGGHGGSYVSGTAMTPSNTDTISVDVITLGSYSITTGDVNGVTFSSSGSFTALGPQTVILYASGTPAADGTFNFPVSGGGNLGCAFSITFDTPAPPAVFTLQDNAGQCVSPTINGTYQATIAVVANNVASVPVDVTTVGSWVVSTVAANGITFTGAGVFTTTGPQNIVLNASGTPIAAGPFNYTITGASNTCTFPLVFDAPPIGNYHCKIDGVEYNFGNNAEANYVTPNTHLSMIGYNIGGISFRTSVNLDGSGTTVVAGTFINDDATIAQGNLITAIFTDINGGSWSPAVSPPLDPFTVTISSISATSVQGSFSGPLHDNFGAGGNMITITEGAFDLPIQ